MAKETTIKVEKPVAGGVTGAPIEPEKTAEQIEEEMRAGIYPTGGKPTAADFNAGVVNAAQEEERRIKVSNAGKPGVGASASVSSNVKAGRIDPDTQKPRVGSQVYIEGLHGFCAGVMFDNNGVAQGVSDDQLETLKKTFGAGAVQVGKAGSEIVIQQARPRAVVNDKVTVDGKPGVITEVDEEGVATKIKLSDGKEVSNVRYLYVDPLKAQADQAFQEQK